MKSKTLKRCFIFLLSIYLALSLKCGENEITGCKECGTGVNSQRCKTCENKYFLALEGEVCVRCNDSLLGMTGCDGNCEMIKSERNVKCEENKCKEGFYEISPGACSICSLLSPYCTKCSYSNIAGQEEKEFECLECDSNYYYLSPIDNTCKYCNLPNCNKCLNETFCEECYNYDHYTWISNGTCIEKVNDCKTLVYSEEKKMDICSECMENYVLHPNGSCIYFNQLCKKAEYSEEKGIAICLECDKNYILYPDGTCVYLDYNCINGVYSQEKNKGICLQCPEQYYINSKEKCTHCSGYQNEYNKDFTYCKSCHRDIETNNLLCDSVEEGYYITSSGQNVVRCSNSISGCNKCSFHSQEDLESNKLKCDECQSGYYISSDELSCKACRVNDNNCIICSDEETQTKCENCSYGYAPTKEGVCVNCKEKFGEACSSCALSIFDLEPHCSSCQSGYTFGIDGKCIHCVNDAHLTGCSYCSPLGKTEFVCDICKSGYVLFDGKCLEKTSGEFTYCKELENIGSDNEPLLSCRECTYSSYIFAIKENGAKDCIDPSDYPELLNCLQSRKENVGENNYTCIKCSYSDFKLVYDEEKKKYTCSECIDGYYKYSSSYCRKCMYAISNCVKCHREDSITKCDTCDTGYLLNKYNICLKCPNNCKKCSLDENSEIRCDEYKIPLFLNNNNEVDSCIKYIDNCGKCSYSNDKELVCDQCIEDYFKNKNSICEHCTINEEVGPMCISCTDDEDLKKKAPCQKCLGNNYFLTKENTCIFCKSEDYGGLNCGKCGYVEINGIEKIGCIECNSGTKVDGKCINYISGCKKYGSFTNASNIIEYGCIECYEDYNLTESYQCQYFTTSINVINTNKIIYPEFIEQYIEGCSTYGYKSGSYYCTRCLSGYILDNGYCYKKATNPFLDYCLLLSYNNGFYSCLSCSSNRASVYLDSDKACENKYYDCTSFENIGSKINPIYSCKYCSSGDTTIIYENNVKDCLYNILQKRCNTAKVDTYYYTNRYSCLECRSMYFLSYSDYYEDKVCKYIYEDEPANNISLYDSDVGTPTTNGKCSDKYFTRNGKVCIKCDDEDKGMPGCGGKCSFKLNRENQLQCEAGKCKENYFETLPGKCALCSSAISYCEKCEYTLNEETTPKFRPIRKRRLICNKCSEGLFLSNGECLSCSQMIPGCNNCIEESNQIKCKEVSGGYYFDSEGQIKRCQSNCEECSIKNVEGKDKLICTKLSFSSYYIDKEGNPQRCDDNCRNCSLVNEGGVDKVKCNEAYSGYYIDELGRVNRCEENCDSCSLINKNGENKVECLRARYSYFLNKDKKIIKCSDEKEGMVGCDYCEFDSKLKCNYCSSGYELVDNVCKSIEELYNLEGCKFYRKINNTYYCSSCNDDYIYIINLKICVKKTEETNLCYSARAIKSGDNTFYNCTSCSSNSNYHSNTLVKNNDGYFKCYYYEYFERNENNYCGIITNIRTFKEPFFICESCKRYSMHVFYDLVLINDEYGNKYCSYNDNHPYSCIKMNMSKSLDSNYIIYSKSDYYYDYKYNYNCTECELKYALEYDEHTESNKCTPLECGVPYCTKCSDNDVYNCVECKRGFVFTKLGYCYIKPRVTPTIVFKDIFRFAMNGLISGSSIFGYSFYLRGLTSDQITERHSFVVSAMFSSNNELRILEESENLNTSCVFESEIDNSDDSEIKFVDYKCSLNSDKDLINDYKMKSLKEGDNVDEDNLKAFNLDDLVNNVDDINKFDSLFDNNELNKYILFTVDNNSKLIEVKNTNNSDFTIFGTTNKIMNNNLLGKLTFLNTDNKIANCEINATDKDNALIKCNADISKIVGNNLADKLSFKERELKGENNNVYFDGLNEVEIISIIEEKVIEKEEEEEEEKDKQDKNKKGKKTGLIVGVIVGSLAFIALVILLIYLFIRYKNKLRQNNEKNTPEKTIPYNQNENNNENNIETNRKIN